jgi:taurine transport system substrate-binding protein
VRNDFAEKNPDFVTKFARVTLDAYAAYRANPKAWLGNADNLDKVVRITGAKKEDIAGLLEGNVFPLAKEQSELLGKPTVKALTDTAGFLKEQGKVDTLQSDYAPFVSSAYISKASTLAAR